MSFPSRRTCGLGAAPLVALLLAAGPAPSRDEIARGREIFHREWIPNDARSHQGDGVGPVYNDTSCVACHNLGAPGGAGPASKNVDILSAFEVASPAVEAAGQAPREDEAKPDAKPAAPSLDELVKAHAGFRTARSVVLHRFGSDPNYESWRLKLLGQPSVDRFGRSGTKNERAEAEMTMIRSMSRTATIGMGQSLIGSFSLVQSQRNTTPLFGSGLIDAIPERVIEANSREPHPRFPEIHGRASRVKGGRIGRFGWKSQTSTLSDFVLTACAVELGLDVPDHHQAGIPYAPNYKAPGQDLGADECAALVAFVGSLPAPGVRPADGPQEKRTLAAGRTVFEATGCAACHSPKLGHVEGIFSDLLLHDMGPELADIGAYGSFVPDSPDQAPVDPNPPLADAQGKAPPVDKSKVIGAMRLEWRTPPLWGVRDSGPYLHDGRAGTLEEAIAHHGGEAEQTARRYFQLTPKERLQLQTFLKSLVAPEPAPAAEVARLQE